MTRKPIVYSAAILVFGICTYLFLLGNGIFHGKFENDLIAWYFLAKGIFCSVSLVLARAMLEALRSVGKGSSTSFEPHMPNGHESLPLVRHKFQ